MTEVNSKFNSFGYITDPQEAAKEKKDAKLDKIKKEQQARSQSLFEQLQEQRKVYKEVKNAFYQAKSENHRLKEKTRLYQSSEYLRKQNQEKYDVRVKTVGGGVVSQCGAIRHGISRALVKVNEEYKNVLRSEGLLTRDPRVKERKKYGRKRARKRFQFSKR